MYVRAIKIINKDGSEEVFESVKDCAKKIGYSFQSVKKHAQKHDTDRHGRSYHYIDGWVDKYYPANRKEVLAFYPDGRTVVYPSVSRCAKALGVVQSTVHQRINTGTPTRRGIYLDYAMEEN